MCQELQFFSKGKGPQLSPKYWFRVDSCKFKNANSDVIGNNCSILFFISTTFGAPNTVIDSVYSPNCYWGDPFGPMNPSNPSGTGLIVPNNVRFFPFRTTPVFPTTGLSKRTIAYSLPNEIELLPVYPNPFNGDVTIRYFLPKPEPVAITVWNELGQVVTTIHDPQSQASGNHSFHWSTNLLASARYYVRVNGQTGVSRVLSVVYVR